MKTTKLLTPITDAAGCRRNSVAVRVVGPDWQPVAPAYYRDKGYQSDRGNVWKSAPVGAMVFSEVTRDGSPHSEWVAIVLADGGVRELSTVEALLYWRAFEARFGSRELAACPMPETVSAGRLKEFEARFGMKLGRYVAIVSMAQIPAPKHYDWAEGRRLDHDYAWTAYDNVSHHEKDGWRIAVVSYSRQPFRSNKFTLAARLKEE
jgi:hypothetical protein